MQDPKAPQSDTTPRGFPRARVTGQVLIHDEERLFIAPLLDLSVGGVFVQLLVHIPVGRQVKLVMKGPRLEAPVQAFGTVVRIEQASRKGLAVQFTQISENAKDTIESCVFESRMEAALKAS